ncbi:MAG TPA: response regulator transcription factor [Hyphomicrobium sp.]|nr:response regulator transcription factor [Hyphomicrobium sp.]
MAAPPHHILVVDDDPEIRQLLRAAFEAEGMHVREASQGAECADLLAREPIDLVTLDLNLGGEDGLRIARELRARRNVPIVMITGKADPIDRIVGLELGADDYIVKPFHMREVVARVRAVLRRYEAGLASPAENGHAGKPRYDFDGWRFDTARREVRNPSGEVCDLTTAEFNLLRILLERPGRVLSRDELMDQLKGHDWSPLDRSIDALVARLRKKIEPHSERPMLIKTVRGVGYAFGGTVRRL